MVNNGTDSAVSSLSPGDRAVIRNARIAIVTPLAFLVVAIVGGVLISSEAIPKSLGGVFRIPGQALPLLAVAALSVGVIVLHNQARWRKEFVRYFVGGGLAQLAPLLLLMHHVPAVLIAPLLPAVIALAYTALNRRSRHDAVG